MASLAGSFHLWTVKHATFIPDENIGCHSYHEKSEQVLPHEHTYYEERKQYEEAQGLTWIPKNKRPEKLRDNLREAEELLYNHKCIHIRWRTRRYLQVILSNGVLIAYILSGYSGDVERVFIDRSLANKIGSEVINDVLFTDTFMALTYCDKAKLEYIQFNRKLPAGQAIKKLEKLSLFDLKFSQLDLPGPSGRRLDRRMSVNSSQDLILVWWPTSSDEAWPWSPMVSDRDRANLSVLSVAGNKVELLCFTRTDCDPLYAGFSNIQSHQIFTIEQTVVSGGELNVDNCIYETSKNKIQRAAVTTIPLKTVVLSHSRNHTEEKLVIGCEDGSLVLYDDYRRITQMTQAAVTPKVVNWHPDGMLIFIANSKAEIQVFDAALAPILIMLTGEHYAPQKILRCGQYFRSAVQLKQMSWCNMKVLPTDQITNAMDAMILYFEGGPIAMFQLCTGILSPHNISATHLVKEYISHRQLDEAINLLTGLNWNQEGQTCIACLSAIVNDLLKRPLNVDSEAQLEAALGAFYAPSRSLAEVTVVEYRDTVMKFARRFFHHLLRYSRFDKAFLLAVDIGVRDLFMDIHYLALDRGELALAEVARKKAEAIEVETGDTETESSSSGTGSDDNSDDESYEDSNESYYETDLDKPDPSQKPEDEQPRIRLHRAPNGTISNGSHPRVYNPGYNAEELDADLKEELYNEYTQALLQNPSAKSSGERRDITASNVKVIHFGLV